MSFDNSWTRKNSITQKQFPDDSYELHKNSDQKQQLLKSIECMLSQRTLVRHETIRIRHWVQKLSQKAHNIVWAQNQNFYLRALKQMLNVQKIVQPFNAIPPEGPLPRLTLFDIPYPIRDRLHKIYSCPYDDQNWNLSNFQTKRQTSRSKSSLKSSYKTQSNLKNSGSKNYLKKKSLLNSVSNETHTNLQRAYQQLNLVPLFKTQTKKDRSKSKQIGATSVLKNKERKLAYEQLPQENKLRSLKELQLSGRAVRSKAQANNINLQQTDCRDNNYQAQQAIDKLFKPDFNDLNKSQRVPVNVRKIKKNIARQKEDIVIKRGKTIFDMCSNVQPARSRSKQTSLTPDDKCRKSRYSKSPLTCFTDFTQHYGSINQSEKVQKSLQVMKDSLLFLGQYYQQFKDHKQYKQLIQNIVKAASRCGQNFLELTLENPLSQTQKSNHSSSFSDSFQKSRISLIFEDQEEELRNDFKQYSKQIQEKFNQTGTQAAQFMQYLQTVKKKQKRLKQKFLKRSMMQIE